MLPERWKQIEDIFQEALDLSGAAREEFVREKCAGDEDLLSEVEKYIARFEAEDSFLESPVWTDSQFLRSQVKREIVESFDEEISPKREEKSYIGERVGVYELKQELGKGGMGIVFLATRADGEFSQKAAIKLIKRGMDTDFIVKRFRHERQILANFNHPNIARLLDGGTTKDGSPYFVMEFVEGEPVHRFIESRKYDLRRKLELFLQICAAIAYAHGKQIIHRDIKPSNILVTDDGTPKLLDFGIAKILDPDLIHESVMPTATQMRLMTPEYASPEQVRGEEITPASDQYSLGVLLYEMLTGNRPYKFPSRAPHEIARIICEEIPSQPSSGDFGKFITENALLSELDKDFCKKLDRIVLKSLRKNPLERYVSIKDFAADIERFLRNETVRAELFTETTESFETPQNFNVSTNGNQKSIAVLPFKNLNRMSGENTGDGNFLSIGLADALITRLSNVRQFVVRPTSSVLRFSGNDSDSFEAGSELNVNFVLDGNILKTEKRIRVSVQLLDVERQSTVWAERFDEDLTDVLTLEDSISKRVAELLVPHLSIHEVQNLSKRGTNNAEAYEAYLRGRFHWNILTEDQLAKAIAFYRRAIELDPNYAAAHAAIADYYCWLGMYGVLPTSEFYPAAKKAALRSLELDPRSSEAYAALGLIELYGRYDWKTSEDYLNRAVELNPNNAVAHLWFTHTLYSQRRFAEGEQRMKRALELNSFNFQFINTQVWGLYFQRRLPEALAAARKMVEQYPSTSFPYFAVSLFSNFIGKTEDSIRAAESAAKFSEDSLFTVIAPAQSLAAAGSRREALEILENPNLPPISNYHKASIYCYLKDKNTAFQILEKSFAARESSLIWLGVEPSLDFLRDDERYFSLLEKMNHPLANMKSVLSANGSKKIAAPERQISTVASEAETVVQTAAAPSAEIKKRGLSKGLKYTLAAAALVIFVWLLYEIATHTTISYTNSNEGWRKNFAAMKAKTLTDSGRAMISAISPDGRQIVYVSRDDDRQSLWIRDTDSINARQIVAPDTVLIAGITFAPDGRTIYYTSWGQNFIARNLYRVSVEGNDSPHLVLEQVNNGIGIAPDGKSFAFVSYDRKQRISYLQIASIDENGEVSATRTLADYPEPGFIRANPAFAPDGKKIAYVVGETVGKKDSMSLSVFDLNTNAAAKIGGQIFADISGVAWREQNEIVLSGDETDGFPYKLWAIAYPSGEAAQLNNDFNGYFNVSISNDSSAVVTSKRERSSAVWLVNLDSPDNGKQLSAGDNRLDGLNGVSWTNDNRILYVGGIGTQLALAIMNADGSNNRVLDVNAVKPSFPSMTKDGRYVVFADTGADGSTVQRYDTQSGALVQLTPNYAVKPSISPDNQFVVYSSNNAARKLSLHKIPIGGGDETEITSALSAGGVISPDGKRIACYYLGEETGSGWRLVILSAENGAVERVISPPDTFNILTPIERPLAWSPDGRTLYYVNDKNNVSNVFRLSVNDEKPPQQTTFFTSGRIFDFSISPDGKRAVIARGSSTSNIVIFKNSTSPR